jgi:hypothetical protein
LGKRGHTIHKIVGGLYPLGPVEHFIKEPLPGLFSIKGFPVPDETVIRVGHPLEKVADLILFVEGFRPLAEGGETLKIRRWGKELLTRRGFRIRALRTMNAAQIESGN